MGPFGRVDTHPDVHALAVGDLCYYLTVEGQLVVDVLEQTRG